VVLVATSRIGCQRQVRKKNKTIKFISKEEKEEKITIPLN
jgi:hypothetical protein